MTVHLSEVLSELRALHGLSDDGDLPGSVISRRLAELLRHDDTEQPEPAEADPSPSQGSTPSQRSADSLP